MTVRLVRCGGDLRGGGEGLLDGGGGGGGESGTEVDEGGGVFFFGGGSFLCFTPDPVGFLNTKGGPPGGPEPGRMARGADAEKGPEPDGNGGRGREVPELPPESAAAMSLRESALRT